jgi:hypothetical protein
MKRKLSKLLGIGLTLALLVSLFVTAVPAAAITQPQVVLTTFGGSTPYEITRANVYTVTSTAGATVPLGGKIVIAFPAGGPNPSGLIAAGDVTIEALAGLGGTAMAAGTPCVYAVTGSAAAGYTLTITMPAALGNGALFSLTIGAVSGVVNPGTPGSYTLTLATQTALGVPIEAAVTSAAYTIVVPGILPLPGIVSAYSASGILMSQSTSINTGILAAGIGGRVEVAAGYYDENAVINANVAGQTIIATGAAGTVIIKDVNNSGTGGVMAVSVAPVVAGVTPGVTIDGFVIQPSATAPQADMLTITAAASYVTIQNCTINSGTNSCINVIAASTNNAVKKSTLDATGAIGAKIGVVAAGQVAVSDTTIKVGASATSQAMTSAAGAPLLPTSMTNCTVTGSSGLGVSVTAGVMTITTSTLEKMLYALSITGGTVTMTGSTVSACGGATAGTNPAIQLTTGTTATLYNNTIKDTTAGNYAVMVGAAFVTPQMNFNNFTGNALNLNDLKGINAENNYWGASTGPAAGSVVYAATTSTTPWLNAASTKSVAAYAASSIVSRATVGVDVTSTKGGVLEAVEFIAVSQYSGNPEISTPPIAGTGKVISYYDVYVKDITPGVSTPDTVQILFYNSAITAYTKVYYAGSVSGIWTEPSKWGVNVPAGYAYCTVSTATVPATNPTILELNALPFALVEDKTTAAPAITAAAGGSPVIGSYDVSINPMFTWGVVPGAIRYEIALSEDPTFAIPEWSYNVDNNFYKVDEALRYDTTYYWRVRGVLGEPFQEAGAWKTPSTPWATGIFTTEAEPAPAAEPIVVEPTKPIVNVEVPPTKITVEPANAAIPTYILWIIVVVGAVLVIALIVLIVRTRRVV